jgi:hypothetical protein
MYIRVLGFLPRGSFGGWIRVHFLCVNDDFINLDQYCFCKARTVYDSEDGWLRTLYVEVFDLLKLYCNMDKVLLCINWYRSGTYRFFLD